MVGASPRSLRRWRQAGRAQLQALALEGRLEQRLTLAFERAQATELENWETIAAPAGSERGLGRARSQGERLKVWG
jgi:hypothetical protein